MYFEVIFVWMVDRVDNMLQNILSYIFDFQALNTFCLSLTDHMWLFLLQKLFSSNFFEREASFFKVCISFQSS